MARNRLGGRSPVRVSCTASNRLGGRSPVRVSMNVVNTPLGGQGGVIVRRAQRNMASRVLYRNSIDQDVWSSFASQGCESLAKRQVQLCNHRGKKHIIPKCGTTDLVPGADAYEQQYMIFKFLASLPINVLALTARQYQWTATWHPVDKTLHHVDKIMSSRQTPYKPRVKCHTSLLSRRIDQQAQFSTHRHSMLQCAWILSQASQYLQIVKLATCKLQHCNDIKKFA